MKTALALVLLAACGDNARGPVHLYPDAGTELDACELYPDGGENACCAVNAPRNCLDKLAVPGSCVTVACHDGCATRVLEVCRPSGIDGGTDGVP